MALTSNTNFFTPFCAQSRPSTFFFSSFLFSSDFPILFSLSCTTDGSIATLSSPFVLPLFLLNIFLRKLSPEHLFFSIHRVCNRSRNTPTYWKVWAQQEFPPVAESGSDRFTNYTNCWPAKLVYFSFFSFFLFFSSFGKRTQQRGSMAINSMNSNWKCENMQLTANQRFPAATTKKSWVQLIPMPQYIAEHWPQLVRQEKAILVKNYEKIIRLKHFSQNHQTTPESNSQRRNSCGSNQDTCKYVFKYKTVDKKVRPIPGITPEDTKVNWQFPSDPLMNLPHLPKKPPAHGMNWIILCWDDISGITEGRALPKDNSKNIATFFREQILLRYGAIGEVVTDNGPSLQGAFERLTKEFNIKQINISPYNPQANGVVERAHFTIWEGLMRICQGDPTSWPKYLQAAIFADWITVRMLNPCQRMRLIHLLMYWLNSHWVVMMGSSDTCSGVTIVLWLIGP